MSLNLESYVLLNLGMNLVVLALCARVKGHISWTQLLFAAGFGTLYAVAMLYEPFHQLRAWPMRLGLGALLGIIAVGAENAKQALGAAALNIGCTAFLGGVVQGVYGMTQSLVPALILGALIGGMMFLTASRGRARRLERWEVELILSTKYGRCHLNALIDTGNQLHEPLSGLPVVIAEQSSIHQVLPPDFDVKEYESKLPMGFRMVGYGALGARGKLLCFKPERLMASYGDAWMRAPDVWVAVYPGQMPGKVTALAPPVIGRVQPSTREELSIGKGQSVR